MWGKFIVFEGIDGSGKTTQVGLLANRMQKENLPVYCTHEPTEGPVGQLIREIYSEDYTIDRRKVVPYLYVADRMDHITNPEGGILEQLSRGITVLCDRFSMSSNVYQFDEKEPRKMIVLNQALLKVLKPDVTIYLDVSPETAYKRVMERGEDLDVIDLKYLQILRKRYLNELKFTDAPQVIRLSSEKISPTDLNQVIWDRLNTVLFEGGTRP